MSLRMQEHIKGAARSWVGRSVRIFLSPFGGSLGGGVLLTCLCGATSAIAEPSQGLTLGAFVEAVEAGNLELRTQQLGVAQVRAQVGVAQTFLDPSLSGGLYSLDVSGQGQPTSVGAQLTVPLEGVGKRSHRIRAAQADVQVAQLQLQDAARTLRGRAAIAYIEALHMRLTYAQKQKTLESLEKLVRLNELRLRAGDIGEVSLLQSQVEAQQFKREVLGSRGELEAADAALAQLLGRSQPESAGPLVLQGDLRRALRSFELSALLQSARQGRVDLRAQEKQGEASGVRVELAKRNRGIDVAMSLGWTRNLATKAEAFAQPTNDTVSAQLSVPLPLSRIYHGELAVMQAAQSQAQAQLSALELKIETEVRQALCRYRAEAERVALYDNGVLATADRVLTAILYNYQRGGATLLEVLTAQRSANEVYLTYYESLAETAKGLVELELAAGLWDIEL